MENNELSLFTVDSALEELNEGTTIGKDEEFGLEYIETENNYLIKGHFGQTFELEKETVDRLCVRTQYEKTELMNILYLVYNAFESYDRFLKHAELVNQDDLQLINMEQNVIVDVVAELLIKHNYALVYSYLEEMKDFDILCLFNMKTKNRLLKMINEDLDNRVVESSEESYSGEPEELVSVQFYK